MGELVKQVLRYALRPHLSRIQKNLGKITDWYGEWRIVKRQTWDVKGSPWSTDSCGQKLRSL
jgi:hypothetical protein